MYTIKRIEYAPGETGFFLVKDEEKFKKRLKTLRELYDKGLLPYKEFRKLATSQKVVTIYADNIFEPKEYYIVCTNLVLKAKKDEINFESPNTEYLIKEITPLTKFVIQKFAKDDFLPSLVITNVTSLKAYVLEDELHAGLGFPGRGACLYEIKREPAHTFDIFATTYVLEDLTSTFEDYYEHHERITNQKAIEILKKNAISVKEYDAEAGEWITTKNP